MPPDSSFDRVYVGRMPRAMNELALREAFSAVGIDVREVEVVIDRWTGLSRGFAYVLLRETVHPDVDALPLARMRSASFDGCLLDVRAVPRRPPFTQ